MFVEVPVVCDVFYGVVHRAECFCLLCGQVIGYEIGLLRVPLEDEVRQKYVDRIERLREEWRKSVKESGLYRQ